MSKTISLVLFLFAVSTTIHAQKSPSGTVTIEVLTVNEQTVKGFTSVNPGAHSETYEQSFRVVTASFKLPDGKVVNASCSERPKQYSSHEPFPRTCPQLVKGTYQAKVYKKEIWLSVTSEKKPGKLVTREFVFDLQ